MPREPRHVCFTINNYSLGCIKSLSNAFKHRSTYFVIGEEVGDEGTPHIQGYIELKSAMTYTAFNKAFSPKKVHGYANCQTREGTPREAAGYCKKGEADKPEGGYEIFYDNPHKTWQGLEWGEVSKQGNRKDLKKICDQIKSGEVTVDELTLTDPILFHQYGRTLRMVEDLVMRKRYRTEMTKGIWYWGSTGVGKSHKAYNYAKPHEIYNWKNDKGWQDGYTQQKVVIINDFRGHIPYDQLLTLVDKWPYEISRRGREPVPFTSRTVIITSSLPPDKIYWRREEGDSIDQLLRRFDVVHLETSTSEQIASAQKCSEGVIITPQIESFVHEMQDGLSAQI